MIYRTAPQDFSPRFETVSCFCEHEGQFLLLLRQDSKSEGNKWGVPAGKIDPGEDALIAMVRELKEETGLLVEPARLTYFNKIYVRYPDYDFVYHMFSCSLPGQLPIIIDNREHKDFTWRSPRQALALPLVKDFDTCIEMFYSVQN